MKNRLKASILNFNFSAFLSKKNSIYFILINIIVAFLGFVRSFVFMKFLDFEELGLLTLVQTGAMFIGFFQIGLINGGYRIVALQKSDLTEKTNNVIFSYFAILFLFLLIIYLVNSVTNVFSDSLIFLFLLGFGFSLLVFNWLTNTLIAEGKHSLLNKVNFVSAMMSVLCLPMAYYWGVYGGVFCLLIQPVVFCLCILIFSKKLRPTRYLLNIVELKEILHYGFIPFVSGIFFLLYIQIERWSITLFLGTTALGNMYLFILVTTLWVLVPVSIMNLIFPKCVILFEKKNYLEFNKFVRNHFYIVLGYCLISIVILMLFLKPLIGYVFPEHLPFVNLVYLGIPGLIFRTLSDPIAVFLNSVVKLKPILWSDIISTVSYLSLILLLWSNEWFSLTNVIMGFNLYFIVKFLYLLIHYFKLRKVYL
jgi:O-antigen/teichoic acid export membrane protein